MKVVRSVALCAGFALLAMVVAYYLHRNRPAARPASGPGVEAAKSPVPKARDFHRKPPPQDTVIPAGIELEETVGAAHPWAAYLKVRDGVQEVLNSKNTDLAFNDTDLLTILADIERQAGIPIRVDFPPEISAKLISFQVKELRAKHVLRLLCQQYGARYVVDENGVIWIVAEDQEKSGHEPPFIDELLALEKLQKDYDADIAARAKQMEQEDLSRQARATMAATNISANFSETTLPDVISQISETAQLNVMIDRRAIEDPDGKTLTLALDSTKIQDAMDLIVKLSDLDYRVDSGVIVVTTKEDNKRRREEEETRKATELALKKAQEDLLARSVAFGGENLRLRDVADMLAKGLGVPYLMDPASWNRTARFTIEERQRPASGIVTLLRKGAPLRVLYRNGILYFLSGGK